MRDPTDALSLFLEDIPKGPLLTAPQEQALARRMHEGNIAVPPPGSAYPTPAEALERMVESNLRLVISVARRYAHRGLPIDDLIQEGVLGLRHAAQRFDPDRGFRFSTYATWWIRQAVTRTLSRNVRSIRLPVHISARIPHVQRAEQKLRVELGRNATSAEVAAEVGLSSSQVDEAVVASALPVSLDQPSGQEGDMQLSDIVADAGPGPEGAAEATSFVEAVAGVLEVLNLRERAVLSLRHGIGTDQPQSLEEIGRVLGVSRERIRQIEAQALRRLRASRAARNRLAEWM